MLFLFLLISNSFIVAAEEVELTFYFPVQVAGPLANAIDNMTTDFNDENPEITVTPVYSGNYDQTMQRTQASSLAGTPPDVAVLLAIDALTLRHSDLIISLDKFAAKDPEYINDFAEGFMDNSILDGKLWGIPFQRSTPLFYYNKDLFAEAGLDKPPADWDELLSYAKQLTKGDKKGLTIVTKDTWLLQAFILQNGGIYGNKAGTEPNFDSPKVIGALEFWVDLANKHKVMPRHRDYGEASADFVAGQTAMMYNSTGSLSFVKDSADFEFGTAVMPAGEKNLSPTGGGNFYIFKNLPKRNQEAAWNFIKWMTTPENVAKWSIVSGYTPVRKSAIKEPVLQDYYEEFPQAEVALDQLESGFREMSFYNNTQVREIFLTAIQNALDEIATPEEAMINAQKQAERILRNF